MMSQQFLENEAQTDESVVTDLDISHLVIEDDTPVDNLQSAQQQRLLVEPLYSSTAIPRPFLADANVGLFYKAIGSHKITIMCFWVILFVMPCHNFPDSLRL